MNPPWQPPDTKRFRPNDQPPDRQWIPPPHHNPIPHQPHVHPSRQAQLPPPPPIAPYHQPPPPQPAPYYPPPHGQPYHNAPPQYYPPQSSHNPHSHPQTHHTMQRRTQKSSDPRRNRHNHQITHPIPTPIIPAIETHENTKSNVILDVLHISADETKNFGSFAVTLSQIYGSRNIDGLPFGFSGADSIEFDGRIRSQPILQFLPEAIDTPSKKVRVYELSPLAATDKRSYDELVAFFTKHERCPVVDKEYNMGILLYFVPPKLIFKRVDPLKGQILSKKKEKKAKKAKKKRTNFVELLALKQRENGGKVSEDRLWMISITSTSKYLLFKQKQKEKSEGKGNASETKKGNVSELSDIEISTDGSDSETEEVKGDGKSGEEVSENGKGKRKESDIVKSELIVALEGLYEKIGQKLPDY